MYLNINEKSKHSINYDENSTIEITKYCIGDYVSINSLSSTISNQCKTIARLEIGLTSKLVSMNNLGRNISLLFVLYVVFCCCCLKINHLMMMNL